MIEDNVVGNVKENRIAYDLINVIMICLGSSEETDQEILRLLDVLLKDASSLEEKKRKLSEEFHIPVTQEIEGEVKRMCNLSDGIEKKGIEQGIEQGEMLKVISQIMKKYKKSKTLETIADELECEIEEIYEFYQAIKQCGVDCEIKEVMSVLEDRKMHHV